MKIIKDKYIQLSILEKQKYIKLTKDKFERELAKQLDLVRVSAPLLVTRESGLQDDLSGVERTVAFDILKDGKEVEIVQSLAKWKRMALKKYGISTHKGLYTDMTAIRRDDKMDETHSIYVDQWDWEKVILKEDRTIEYLKQTVRKIVKAIVSTSKYLKRQGLDCVDLSKDVFFITSQELLDMYPDKSDKEREYLITKKYKTVFIIGIGDKLSDGKPHDLRAPDYDDWSLNGDLLFYHEVLDIALEISSMGIRVDKVALIEQLEKSGKQERLQYAFHQAIIKDQLPLTIGGGIGQSRLCMLLMGRAHIGEVQSSYWDKQTIEQCKKLKIELL
ncbi:MAG: aspartate--ammonia ligase [Eubacteriales bacterium]|nr:aspartate--ammonia ligase [Eubacteriales bacterium]